MRGHILIAAVHQQDNRFLQKQIHKALKMDLKEAVKIVRNQGFSLAYFGKDLPKLIEGSKDCNIFGVFTRSGGDELYYPEGDVNTIGNWIRCGDPTGLLPEWRDVVDDSGSKMKFYLAGENPGIDCTSVMDDMFANEGGKNYTYALCRKFKKITKIAHPQDYLDLSTSPTPFKITKANFYIGEHFGKLWRTAKDFSALISLSQKYLSGKIPYSPYHPGPIDEETIPLLPGLLKLHDFGLFTFSSQPYKHSVYESGEEWTEDQQRPFVSFIMPGKDGLSLEFFKRLKERADVVVYAQELCPFKMVDSSHDPHDVSRKRIADTVKDLETAEWEVSISVCSSADVSDSGDLYLPDAMKLVKPVLFDVAASEWGVQLDLLGVIEGVAVDCGLSLNSSAGRS
jgi:hypothetical protein